MKNSLRKLLSSLFFVSIMGIYGMSTVVVVFIAGSIWAPETLDTVIATIPL